jgi:hypothetical protein
MIFDEWVRYDDYTVFVELFEAELEWNTTGTVFVYGDVWQCLSMGAPQ